MGKKNVLSVFGARPDTIKMCPLVLALGRDEGVHSLVCVTAQHREMVDQVMAAFGVKPDYDLDIMRHQQTLTDITNRVLTGMRGVLEAAKPDIVLVHGDTTTCFAAALAAFYAGVTVGHVEAGLRTETIDSPFPEELNRRLVGRIAKLHFAPTQRAADNLAAEGITTGVYMTGNTEIDALRYTVRKEYAFDAEALHGLDFGRNIVVVTAHRRENHGERLENILTAVRILSETHPDARFVFPVHPNPAVREKARAMLGGKPGILLTEPLAVFDMHNLIARSSLVLTDSGGLQEDAPALGAPVLVLRTETERPEVIEAGTAVLAGVETDNIVRLANTLLSDKSARAAMVKSGSPFGDGYASERIVRAIKDHFIKE